MIFVEFPTFTKVIPTILSDEEYRELQNLLIERPEAGGGIQGAGGIRKLRIAASGRGKRGGARVIYFWADRRDTILMLYAYKKNRLSDLTDRQLKLLSKEVEEYKNAG